MPHIIGQPTYLPVHQIYPYEDAIKLVNEMERQHVPVRIGVCICRRARNMYAKKGEGLNVTDMVFGGFGKEYERYHPQAFKEITYSDAREYIWKFFKAGLVQTIFNACPGRDSQMIICNCDKSACVPMETYREIGFKSFWNSPYRIMLDKSRCTLCLKCIDVCPIECRMLNNTKDTILVNTKMCIGCGVCRSVCETDAIYLNQESDEEFKILPPNLK
jgi:ferredoxin